jgi:hypothetical protein
MLIVTQRLRVNFQSSNLFWRLLSATATHKIAYEAIRCQKRPAFFAIGRLASSASVKVGEFRISLNVSTVLANIKLNVMPCAFVRFLKDEEPTVAAFEVAFEAGIRKLFAA